MRRTKCHFSKRKDLITDAGWSVQDFSQLLTKSSSLFILPLPGDLTIRRSRTVTATQSSCMLLS